MLKLVAMPRSEFDTDINTCFLQGFAEHNIKLPPSSPARSTGARSAQRPPRPRGQNSASRNADMQHITVRAFLQVVGSALNSLWQMAPTSIIKIHAKVPMKTHRMYNIT